MENSQNKTGFTGNFGIQNTLPFRLTGNPEGINHSTVITNHYNRQRSGSQKDNDGKGFEENKGTPTTSETDGGNPAGYVTGEEKKLQGKKPVARKNK